MSAGITWKCQENSLDPCGRPATYSYTLNNGPTLYACGYCLPFIIKTAAAIGATLQLTPLVVEST